MRALIVDDEKKSREVLQSLLENFCEGVTVTGTADDVGSAIEAINALKPELVFLDISLKEGDAFQLLNKLATIDFEIIFITAFDEYSIKALQFSDILCLMKPIDISELQEAIDKTKLLTKHNSAIAFQLADTILKSKFTKIPVMQNDVLLIIETQKLVLADKSVNGTKLILNTGQSIETVKHYGQFEKLLLNQKDFVNLSDSCLVNTNYVITQKQYQSPVKLSTGQSIQVESRFLKKLNEITS
ncbi:MAG: response regulator transcription factor [Bacteroidia bacterium]|nr:response regulator transcription factor [Bacteroidia bacterium]